MAKHPVPKKKVATPASKKRYASFVREKHLVLKPFLTLQPCPKCGEPKPGFLMCPNCGSYRNRTVIDREAKVTKKITKVKA